MKHQAIVGNIGHFDNEIDMAGLAATSGIERINIKPQVDKWVFSDGHAVLVLSEGRLLNLGNATGHPSFVMSNSFANQTIAQIERSQRTTSTRSACTSCPSTSTRRSRACTSVPLGVRLSELTPEQAAYLGVPPDGPYKPDHYRY